MGEVEAKTAVVVVAVMDVGAWVSGGSGSSIAGQIVAAAAMVIARFTRGGCCSRCAVFGNR